MNNFVRLSILLIFVFGLAPLAAEEPFIYDDKGKRDPFVPLVDKDGHYLLDTGTLYSFDELKLFGILWDPEGKSSALINDEVLAVGEAISGFVVQDITKDKVVIYKNGKEYIMRLSIEEKE